MRHLVHPFVRVALLACVVSCGSDGTSSPGQPAGPSAKLDAFSIHDSIQTNYALPLIVTVRDADGKPAKNEAVTASVAFLSSVPSPFLPAMYISSSRTILGQSQLTLSTNADGRVEFWLRNAEMSGQVRLWVRSRFGSDSLDGVILPGRPAKFVLSPRDTALYVGGSVPMSISTRDRLNNVAGDSVTTTVRRPTVLDASQGTLSARGTGRGYVVVASGDVRDSIGVSVVPPGTLIAYNHRSSSGVMAAFYMFGLDGSAYHSFASSPIGYNNHGPRWSTILNRVIYHDSYEPANLNPKGLYTIVDNGTPQPLLPPLSVSDGTTAGDQNATILGPSITGDGTTIYFAATTTTSQTSIWRARSDGTGAVRVGPATTYGVHDMQPTVSRDGRRVAYITDRGTLGSGATPLMMLDLSTGASARLPVSGTHPAWSPNGDEIAYFANGLSVIRPDGTGQAVVAAGNQFDTDDGQIEWSPDAKWLVTCTTGSVSGARQIVLINRASGELLPLAFTAKDNLCEATWKP